LLGIAFGFTSSAEVIIKGVGIHPGEAKDIMVNAILLAMEFN